MSLFTARRDPSVPARTIPEGKVKWLGDPLLGHWYGIHDDREYAVDVRPADPETFVPQADEMFVSRKRIELLDGSKWETFNVHRAWPVKAGTYAGLVARKSPRKADNDQPRAWDRLARLPVMQRREPLRLATGPASSAMDRVAALPSPPSTDEQRAIAEVVDLARNSGQRELIAVGGNEPPEGSVAGMVAYLRERGVELELARGRLVARSRTPIRVDLRELIEQAGELIVGHLQGKPVMCSTCTEPAVTVVFPNAPMCAGHRQ